MLVSILGHLSLPIVSGKILSKDHFERWGANVITLEGPQSKMVIKLTGTFLNKNIAQMERVTPPNVIECHITGPKTFECNGM